MYCSNCGKKLSTKYAVNEGDTPYCEKCDIYYFRKSNIAVLVVLRNTKNEILMLKQKHVNNYFVLIAGYHKPIETLEETVKRETKEETNIDIENIKYIGNYYYEKKDTLMVAYHGICTNDKYYLDKTEVDDALWVSIKEAPKLVRPGSIAQIVLKKYISEVL